MATSLTHFAALYFAPAKYKQAEQLYERAMLINETVYGLDHLTVATSLSGLAVLYEERGKYTKAEPLYKRALKIIEKELSLIHSCISCHHFRRDKIRISSPYIFVKHPKRIRYSNN